MLHQGRLKIAPYPTKISQTLLEVWKVACLEVVYMANSH